MLSDRSNTMLNPSTSVIVTLLATLLIASLLAGCANSKLRRTPTTERPTPWFCEMNESRDDWDCVQDEALASNPRPKRLPSDPAEPNPFDEERPGEDNDDLSGLANPAADVDFNAIEAALAQEHVTRVMDAPPEYFTVQLTTTATEPLAAGFILDHHLKGNDQVMTLELADDTTPYYVVLLGVYPTEKAAEAAADARPESLADVTPWVRPLAPVQTDLSRAQFLKTGATP